MYVGSDAVNAESVLWKSKDDGKTWSDPGGRTNGRHTAFAILKDGRLLGMGGKNSDIDGFMPKSISKDGGKTWQFSKTPFPALASNQRPTLVRLKSGRLFFAGDAQDNAGKQPDGFTMPRGAYVALSDDEGETWKIKRLPGAEDHETPARAKRLGGPTLGYAVAAQAPNGVIHLITSMNAQALHFALNEAWMLAAPDTTRTPTADAAGAAGAAGGGARPRRTRRSSRTAVRCARSGPRRQLADGSSCCTATRPGAIAAARSSGPRTTTAAARSAWRGIGARTARSSGPSTTRPTARACGRGSGRTERSGPNRPGAICVRSAPPPRGMRRARKPAARNFDRAADRVNGSRRIRPSRERIDERIREEAAMRSRRFIAITMALLATWLGAATARAQVTTATVYGLVTDNTEAVLPGADVTLTNEATGAVMSAVSNDRGEFTLTFVPVGRYTLKVSLSGFGDYEQRGLALAAGQVTRLTAGLGVSGVTDTVSVTADAPLVNGANAQQQGIVGSGQLRELPLANRDWSRTVALDPGVALAGNGGVTMNGLPPAALSLTVDGTNGSSDPELPSVGAYQGFNTINGVSTEAIEQISISKGIASAEYGGTMSGNVNIITKGGSNSWRGSLFWNHQRDGFDASNPFIATKPEKRLNQAGGSFGGPVMRNTLFFFVNYEGVRSDRQDIVQGDVPTPEFRAQAIAAQPPIAR